MTAITMGTRHVRHTELRRAELRRAELGRAELRQAERGQTGRGQTERVRSRLQLTRRGRAVLTALIAGPVVALAVAVALNGGMAMASSDVVSGTFDYVTVQAGQSLWELAESVAPAADPREVISSIVQLNQLESSELHPGDRIAIPVEYSR